MVKKKHFGVLVGTATLSCPFLRLPFFWQDTLYLLILLCVSVCVSWQRASDASSQDKMSIAEINGLTTYRGHNGPAGMTVQTLDDDVCQLGQHRFFGTSYNDMATFIDELPTNTYVTGMCIYCVVGFYQ